jgi:nucleotide-binding universal stress UspA family protein
LEAFYGQGGLKNVAPEKILCPTDFSEPSYEAIKVASELASHFAAEILLLHVVTPVSVSPEVMLVPPVTVPVSTQELEAPAKQSLEEMAGRLHLQGLRTRFIILRGDAADEIIQRAGRENVELISIATRGRTGLDRLFFDSVAEKVVRVARCPVLTVAGRPSGEGREETSTEKMEEGKPGEEKSPKRMADQEKMEAQLREWSTKIDELKAKAETSIAELKKKYEEQIGDLRAKQEAVRQKMLELKRSGEESWEELKGGVEKSLDELKRALKRAVSRFKEK